MVWIYTATLIFGCGFLIPMVLGGLGPDASLDFDVGVDADLDVSGGVLETVGPDGLGTVEAATFGAVADAFLSFRTIVFFCAFFGAGGLVLNSVGYQTLVAAFAAAVIGFGAATINSTIFGFVTSSSVGSEMSDQSYMGRIGTVMLPVSPGRRGRIRLLIDGQPQVLSAQVFDDRADEQFDVGTSVVIIELKNGVAHIASTAELGLGEE